jgi:hypothetical protein
MVVLGVLLRYTQACALSSDTAHLRNWHADVMKGVVMKFIDETTMGK